jgi:hypothetical protein
LKWKGKSNQEEQDMKTRMNVRLFGILAVLASAASGLSALATPASAATGPTARLSQGIATVTGTPARDVIAITEGSDRLAVDFGSDGTVDAHFAMSRVQGISVLAGDGDDGVTVDGTGVGDVPITVRAGAGNDGGGVLGNIGDSGDGDALVTINGREGNDNFDAAVPGPTTVNAGAGNDLVEGGGAGIGHETISLGDGNDKFISELDAFVGSRIRSDSVDGGTGQDALEIRGSNASESVSLSAKAGHLVVEHELRDHIDANNVEDVSWFGFGGLDVGGGGDAVIVGDLSGTDVVNFTPNFSAPNDATVPNNSADQLTVVGTAGDDHITLSGSGASITIAGLTPTVTSVLLDSKDVLQINTLAGRDTVDHHALQRGLVQLRVL